MLLWFLLVTVRAGEVYSATEPDPITWTSYDSSSKTLSFSWTTYPGTSPVYKVTYTYKGSDSTLSDTSSTSASLTCTANDETPVTIKYVATVGSTTSASSPAVTLYCAAKPSTVTGLSFKSELQQVVLSWDGASVSDGGSSLLRFRVFRCTGSCEERGVTEATVYSFTDTVEVNSKQYNTGYDYSVKAENMIGQSDSSASTTINLVPKASPSHSVVTFPSSLQAETDFSVSVTVSSTADERLYWDSRYIIHIALSRCLRRL